jgi:NAD-dependent dihydropyrimidine dehydrogenase PreA subunit
MGHLAGKDLYRALGAKVDSGAFRAPWNDSLREILTELYSEEEAALLLAMPYGLASLSEVARATGMEPGPLRAKLEELCNRGLVLDLHLGGEYRYSVSPFVVGIFEFTMMRTDDDVDHKKMARLFHDYLESGAPYAGNAGHGERFSPFRALPYQQTLREGGYAEVLDYEKATSLVEQASFFSLGICSCRHKEEHLGTRACDTPLELCTSFDKAGEYLVRRNLARSISKSEMLEHVDRSRELGLVLIADNVQRGATFICHCCGCCCGVLTGISRHGYAATTATSSFIARSDLSICKGCNHCEKACPIGAIAMVPDDPPPGVKRKKRPAVDERICLGCGVCALKCTTGAMKLDPRPQRVIPPETTFQRVLLMALERGTLQHLIFTNPESRTHSYLRALVGGILQLEPVKRALVGDLLRSRFLALLETGVKLQGKGWLASEI